MAVLILAASLVVFGSGKFFKKTDEYVLFFDGSIKGLTVGSPVLFQGVPIGAVKSIVLEADIAEKKINKPVYVEVEPDRFKVLSNGVRTRKDRLESVRLAIEAGMRAVLSTQSFITGQLMIELDFHPGTPVNLKGLVKDYPEIPTIPSVTARLGKSLEKLNLTELQGYVQSALAGIDQLANNEDLKESLNLLRGILSDARQLVQHVDARVDPLTDNIDGTLGDARKLLGDVGSQVKPLAGKVNTTLDDIDKLARDVDRQVNSLSKSVTETLSTVTAAFKSIDDLVGKKSPTRADLDNTLKDISGAARSLRLLADYLEQHPDALLKGKGGGYRK